MPHGTVRGMPTPAPSAPRRLASGAGFAALAASALACWPAAASAAPAATPQLTSVAASVLAPPQAVVATDGRRHVVYEVMLQNPDPVPVDVQSLAVRVKGGRTLARLSGARLAATMTDAARRPTTKLAPTGTGTIWVDVALRRGRSVPRALVHRLRVVEALPGGEPHTYAFDAVRTRVSRRPATAVAPPLRGGPYLNFNGCCAVGAHRTAIASVDGVAHLSERFAADFIQIDAQGRGGAGDLSRNESFFTYGEPVYAVANGRVVDTLNTLKENVPLNEPPATAFTARTILGNQVVLRLDDGRYAAYGHLQTGSVRVHRGQRVRAGQVLGRVGNTGQSGGAHLHFQLSDGPDELASDGAPFVFGSFSVLGSVSNIDEFLTGAAPAAMQALPSASARHGQMPLQGTVVRFPR